MMVLAIDGPSYSGKTTFIDSLYTHLIDSGVIAIKFPCYMDCLNDATKLSIPLDASVTLEQELKIIELFINIESQRLEQIQAQEKASVAILDRSILSILCHNYALQKITHKPFYNLARQFLLKKEGILKAFDICVYVGTAQSVLDHRYPIDDKTIFTDELYNEYFKEGYKTERRKKTILKNFIPITLSNHSDIPSQIDILLRHIKSP